ncbi:MAG: hypothetical protein AB8B77_06340, partial [Alphaproteobacteria bacterium]
MANQPLKINFGCGNFKLKGYLNVDYSAHCNPDQIMDMQVFPWPFDDNSASDIIMSHVLEHVGQDIAVFEKIIQELYRISAPDCQITIAVPDPYHDNFWGDPTHCRPITPQLLNLLSRGFLKEYQQSAISPIAVMWGVDFAIEKVNSNVDPAFATWAKQRNITLSMDELRYYRNAILDHKIVMRA